MISQKLELYYLAAIVAVGDGTHWWAAAAILALALANSPAFWAWAADIREVAFKDWKMRRRR